MKWGIFTDDEDDVRHVAPVDEQSMPGNGHTVDAECWCDPQVKMSESGCVIVIHRLPS